MRTISINDRSKAFILDIISSLLVLLFVYAAFSKVSDMQKFEIELSKSPVLNSFVKITSLGIPTIELLISIMFFVERLRLAAFYCSFGLMMIFSCYIICILNFSSYIPCSCGGVLQNMTWSQHLIFNIGFIGLSAIAVLLYPYKNLSADKRGIPKTLTRVGN